MSRSPAPGPLPEAQRAPDGSKLSNIIVVYADDVGFGDLSWCNARSACRTSRRDRMAAEGIPVLRER